MESEKNKNTSEDEKDPKIEISEEIVEPIDLEEDIERVEAREAKQKQRNKLKEEIEMRKKKAKLFLYINLVIFVLALISVVGVFFVLSNSKDTGQTELGDEGGMNAGDVMAGIGNRVRRKIDGVMVRPSEDNQFLMAVMIDNHVDARPPSGIDKAHMVFEAEVEGGITRLMAIFSTGLDVEEIGPIRSARPYFVDWAREISALYTHVGGSPDALVKIERDDVLDINEFYNGKYFWRDESRPMPHNVYTSTENLTEFLSDNNVDRNRFIPWTFKDDEVVENRPDTASILIDYRGSSFDVEWKYNKDTNTYLRFVDNEAHQTKNGDFINAKNIIIQVADARELDEKLRLEMENIGSGISLICMDGKCEKGSWEKKHPSDRTRYYMEDGQEAEYNAGLTWIQVVRPEIDYSFN